MPAPAGGGDSLQMKIQLLVAQQAMVDSAVAGAKEVQGALEGMNISLPLLVRPDIAEALAELSRFDETFERIQAAIAATEDQLNRFTQGTARLKTTLPGAAKHVRQIRESTYQRVLHYGDDGDSVTEEEAKKIADETARKYMRQVLSAHSEAVRQGPRGSGERARTLQGVYSGVRQALEGQTRVTAGFRERAKLRRQINNLDREEKQLADRAQKLKEQVAFLNREAGGTPNYMQGGADKVSKYVRTQMSGTQRARLVEHSELDTQVTRLRNKINGLKEQAKKERKAGRGEQATQLEADADDLVNELKAARRKRKQITDELNSAIDQIVMSSLDNERVAGGLKRRDELRAQGDKKLRAAERKLKKARQGEGGLREADERVNRLNAQIARVDKMLRSGGTADLPEWDLEMSPWEYAKRYGARERVFDAKLHPEYETMSEARREGIKEEGFWGGGRLTQAQYDVQSDEVKARVQLARRHIIAEAHPEREGRLEGVDHALEDAFKRREAAEKKLEEARARTDVRGKDKNTIVKAAQTEIREADEDIALLEKLADPRSRGGVKGSLVRQRNEANREAEKRRKKVEERTAEAEKAKAERDRLYAEAEQAEKEAGLPAYAEELDAEERRTTAQRRKTASKRYALESKFTDIAEFQARMRNKELGEDYDKVQDPEKRREIRAKKEEEKKLRKELDRARGWLPEDTEQYSIWENLDEKQRKELAPHLQTLHEVGRAYTEALGRPTGERWPTNIDPTTGGEYGPAYIDEAIREVVEGKEPAPKTAADLKTMIAQRGLQRYEHIQKMLASGEIDEATRERAKTLPVDQKLGRKLEPEELLAREADQLRRRLGIRRKEEKVTYKDGSVHTRLGPLEATALDTVDFEGMLPLVERAREASQAVRQLTGEARPEKPEEKSAIWGEKRTEQVRELEKRLEATRSEREEMEDSILLAQAAEGPHMDRVREAQTFLTAEIETAKREEEILKAFSEGGGRSKQDILQGMYDEMRERQLWGHRKAVPPLTGQDLDNLQITGLATAEDVRAQMSPKQPTQAWEFEEGLVHKKARMLAGLPLDVLQAASQGRWNAAKNRYGATLIERGLGEEEVETRSAALAKELQKLGRGAAHTAMQLQDVKGIYSDEEKVSVLGPKGARELGKAVAEYGSEGAQGIQEKLYGQIASKYDPMRQAEQDYQRLLQLPKDLLAAGSLDRIEDEGRRKELGELLGKSPKASSAYQLLRSLGGEGEALLRAYTESSTIQEEKGKIARYARSDEDRRIEGEASIRKNEALQALQGLLYQRAVDPTAAGEAARSHIREYESLSQDELEARLAETRARRAESEEALRYVSTALGGGDAREYREYGAATSGQPAWDRRTKEGEYEPWVEGGVPAPDPDALLREIMIAEMRSGMATGSIPTSRLGFGRMLVSSARQPMTEENLEGLRGDSEALTESRDRMFTRLEKAGIQFGEATRIISRMGTVPEGTDFLDRDRLAGMAMRSLGHGAYPGEGGIVGGGGAVRVVGAVAGEGAAPAGAGEGQLSVSEISKESLQGALDALKGLKLKATIDTTTFKESVRDIKGSKAHVGVYHDSFRESIAAIKNIEVPVTPVISDAARTAMRARVREALGGKKGQVTIKPVLDTSTLDRIMGGNKGQKTRRVRFRFEGIANTEVERSVDRIMGVRGKTGPRTQTTRRLRFRFSAPGMQQVQEALDRIMGGNKRQITRKLRFNATVNTSTIADQLGKELDVSTLLNLPVNREFLIKSLEEAVLAASRKGIRVQVGVRGKGRVEQSGVSTVPGKGPKPRIYTSAQDPYTPGKPLRPGHLSPEERPEKLYHVTGALDAIRGGSGMLEARKSGGLGSGPQGRGVSFASSLEEAKHLAAEMRRLGKIARGEVSYEDIRETIREQAQDAGGDEKAWLSKFDEAYRKAQELPGGDDPREALFRAYDNFGYIRQRELGGKGAAGVIGKSSVATAWTPESLKILEVGRENIPEGAYVHRGSDDQHGEIRAYSDVSLRGARVHDPDRETVQQLQFPWMEEGVDQVMAGSRRAHTGMSEAEFVKRIADHSSKEALDNLNYLTKHVSVPHAEGRRTGGAQHGEDEVVETLPTGERVVRGNRHVGIIDEEGNYLAKAIGVDGGLSHLAVSPDKRGQGFAQKLLEVAERLEIFDPRRLTTAGRGDPMISEGGAKALYRYLKQQEGARAKQAKSEGESKTAQRAKERSELSLRRKQLEAQAKQDFAKALSDQGLEGYVDPYQKFMQARKGGDYELADQLGQKLVEDLSGRALSTDDMTERKLLETLIAVLSKQATQAERTAATQVQRDEHSAARTSHAQDPEWQRQEAIRIRQEKESREQINKQVNRELQQAYWETRGKTMATSFYGKMGLSGDFGLPVDMFEQRERSLQRLVGAERKFEGALREVQGTQDPMAADAKLDKAFVSLREREDDYRAALLGGLPKKDFYITRPMVERVKDGDQIRWQETGESVEVGKDVADHIVRTRMEEELGSGMRLWAQARLKQGLPVSESTFREEFFAGVDKNPELSGDMGIRSINDLSAAHKAYVASQGMATASEEEQLALIRGKLQLLKQERAVERQIAGDIRRQNLMHELGRADMQYQKQQSRAKSPFRNATRAIGYQIGAFGMGYMVASQVRMTMQTVIQLQQAIAGIQGVLDSKSPEDAQRLKRGIVDISAKYGADLLETAQAARILAQSGLNASQTMQELEKTMLAMRGMDMAIEQMQELQIAVRAVTGELGQTGAVLEKISEIEANYAITASAIADSLQLFSPMAKQFMKDSKGLVDAFDMTIGMATVMVEQLRITGKQAGNALKFLFARVLRPEVAGKLQDDFGVRMATEEGSLLPLPELMSSLKSRYEELKRTDPYRAQEMMVALGGGRRANYAIALMEEYDRAADIAKQSSLAFGSALKRADIQMDTLGASLAVARTSLASYTDHLLNSSGAMWGFKEAADALGASFRWMAEGNEIRSTLGTLGMVGSLGLATTGIKKGSRYVGDAIEAGMFNRMLKKGQLSEDIMKLMGKSGRMDVALLREARYAATAGGMEAGLRAATQGGKMVKTGGSGVMAGASALGRIFTIPGLMIMAVTAILGTTGFLIRKFVREEAAREARLIQKAGVNDFRIDESPQYKRMETAAQKYGLDSPGALMNILNNTMMGGKDRAWQVNSALLGFMPGGGDLPSDAETAFSNSAFTEMLGLLEEAREETYKRRPRQEEESIEDYRKRVNEEMRVALEENRERFGSLNKELLLSTWEALSEVIPAMKEYNTNQERMAAASELLGLAVWSTNSLIQTTTSEAFNKATSDIDAYMETLQKAMDKEGAFGDSMAERIRRNSGEGVRRRTREQSEMLAQRSVLDSFLDTAMGGSEVGDASRRFIKENQKLLYDILTENLAKEGRELGDLTELETLTRTTEILSGSPGLEEGFQQSLLEGMRERFGYDQATGRYDWASDSSTKYTSRQRPQQWLREQLEAARDMAQAEFRQQIMDDNNISLEWESLSKILEDNPFEKRFKLALEGASAELIRFRNVVSEVLTGFWQTWKNLDTRERVASQFEGVSAAQMEQQRYEAVRGFYEELAGLPTRLKGEEVKAIQEIRGVGTIFRQNPEDMTELMEAIQEAEGGSTRAARERAEAVVDQLMLGSVEAIADLNAEVKGLDSIEKVQKAIRAARTARESYLERPYAGLSIIDDILQDSDLLDAPSRETLLEVRRDLQGFLTMPAEELLREQDALEATLRGLRPFVDAYRQKVVQRQLDLIQLEGDLTLLGVQGEYERGLRELTVGSPQTRLYEDLTQLAKETTLRRRKINESGLDEDERGRLLLEERLRYGAEVERTRNQETLKALEIRQRRDLLPWQERVAMQELAQQGTEAGLMFEPDRGQRTDLRIQAAANLATAQLKELENTQGMRDDEKALRREEISKDLRVQVARIRQEAEQERRKFDNDWFNERLGRAKDYYSKVRDLSIGQIRSEMSLIEQTRRREGAQQVFLEQQLALLSQREDMLYDDKVRQAEQLIAEQELTNWYERQNQLLQARNELMDQTVQNAQSMLSGLESALDPNAWNEVFAKFEGEDGDLDAKREWRRGRRRAAAEILRGVIDPIGSTYVSRTMENMTQTLAEKFAQNESLRNLLQTPEARMRDAVEQAGYLAANRMYDQIIAGGRGAAQLMAMAVGRDIDPMKIVNRVSRVGPVSSADWGAPWSGDKGTSGQSYSSFRPLSFGEIRAQASGESESEAPDPEQWKEDLTMQLSTMGGTMAGTALGSAISGGQGQWAGTLSGAGSGLFQLIPGMQGPHGAIIGGIVGGVLGGAIDSLFGSEEPTEDIQVQELQAIEQAIRESITAIEQQTDALLDPEGRLMNIPSTFNVPEYTMFEGASGNGGNAGSSHYYEGDRFEINVPLQINGDADVAQITTTVERAVEDALARTLNQGRKNRSRGRSQF